MRLSYIATNAEVYPTIEAKHCKDNTIKIYVNHSDDGTLELRTYYNVDLGAANLTVDKTGHVLEQEMDSYNDDLVDDYANALEWELKSFEPIN